MAALTGRRRISAVPPKLLGGGAALAIVALLALVMAGVQFTSALFTNNQPANADLGAAAIFRGERDTPAFSVNDVSSGSAVDGSYGPAFASDGRYLTTYALPTAFSSDRYVEFDMNSPLPAGLAASSLSLSLRFSGDSGGASNCVYVEIRSASSGALISSNGSSGSPLGCSSGSTFSTSSPPISGVSTTDAANDLRVRVYARDSAGGALRVDAATVSGSTPYSSFTLYPILSRDRHDGQDDLIRWGLAGS